jgi:hypothetical protein
MNPSLSQSTAGFLANYKHDRMIFERQVGYSRRVSAIGGENTSAFTGLLDFKDQLTPKTGFTVKIDRTMSNEFRELRGVSVTVTTPDGPR